jgi:cytoskeleton protein RodZ
MSNESQYVLIGSTLSKSREVKGLTIKQVAEAIHLPVHVIIAMESDDFESLPSKVFVRGYIRNYVKLLEIDERPFLEAYNERHLELTSQDQADMVDVKVSQAPIAILLMNLFKWLIIIALSLWAGLALLNWMSDSSNNPVPLSSVYNGQEETQASIQSPLQSPEPVADVTVNVVDNDALPTTLAISPEVIVETPPEAENDVNIVPEPEVAKEQNQSEQSQRDQNLAQSVIESADAEKIAEAVEVIQTVMEADQGNIDGFQLSMRMLEDSWIEVLDEQGDRVAFNLYKIGSVESIAVIGQVSIFLGNSPSVEIRVDGVLQDQSDYGYGNNLARFGVTKNGLIAHKF